MEKGDTMKGKLDDGTPVDIEKPEPIEQDGKWWEFTEYRSVKMGDHYLYEMQDGVGYCIEDHRNVFLHWIASEIPRATTEQLRAIGMKERDGKPVICKHDDVVWNGGGFTRLIDFLKDHGEDIYNRHIGKYRFALVPDVQKEVHISCDGCDILNNIKTIGDFDYPEICKTCYPWRSHKDDERKNYTAKQPPQTEEPRFTAAEELEIKMFIYNITLDLQSHREKTPAQLDAMFQSAYELYSKYKVEAFTERRRG